MFLYDELAFEANKKRSLSRDLRLNPGNNRPHRLMADWFITELTVGFQLEEPDLFLVAVQNTRMRPRSITD